MTDIEQKALALLNEVKSNGLIQSTPTYQDAFNAICRAIEQREAVEAENERLREELADAYIKLSGAVQHASDCATSNAPAMKPGACDCKENEWLKRQLNQIAWLAERPYDPDEQLTGGEGCASEGQAGSEA